MYDMIPKMNVESHYYMDQIDTDRKVSEWMESVINKVEDRFRIFFKVEHYGLTLGTGTMPNGGVTVIWYDDKQLGIATTVRDDKNFSVLTIVNTENVNYNDICVGTA